MMIRTECIDTSGKVLFFYTQMEMRFFPPTFTATSEGLGEQVHGLRPYQCQQNLEGLPCE